MGNSKGWFSTFVVEILVNLLIQISVSHSWVINMGELNWVLMSMKLVKCLVTLGTSGRDSPLNLVVISDLWIMRITIPIHHSLIIVIWFYT